MLRSSRFRILVLLFGGLQNAVADLTMSLTGPSSFPKSDQGSHLILNLTNVGEGSMTLLKDPRGLLSPFPMNKFTFTDDKGQAVFPRFIGTRVKYAPDATTPDNYASLGPGESLKVTHDLGEAYDFSQLPAGVYNAAGNNMVYRVKGTGEPTLIQPDSAPSHTFNLVHEEANPKLSTEDVVSLGNSTTKLSDPAGPTFINCTESQEQALISAAQFAQDYASNAFLYANSISSKTSRYSTWFGLYSKKRHDLVVSQFSAISAANFSTFTYNCSCTTSNVYAYVYPDSFGHIYLCGAFWQAPMNGTDSKGGTLVHEASHFVANAGGTEDYTYGQSSCKFISLLFPNEAVKNADSHEYFAENNPART